jgi:hypothetical protein
VDIVSPRLPETAEPAVTKVSPLRIVRKNGRGGGRGGGRGRGGRSAQRIRSNDIIEESDDSEDDVVKAAAQPVTVKIKVGKAATGPPPEAQKPEEDAPINLLKSLADEVSETLNKEKALKEKEKETIGKRRKSDDDKKSKEKASPKDKEKEKERKRKHQHHAQAAGKQLDDRERKRFRPDRRDEVDPEEKKRIKEKARLLMEQAKKDKETLKKIGSPASSSFSRIPKIPKKAAPDDGKLGKEGKSLSFEAMLGGLDAKPKTVKTPLIKNKTAALLESFSKTKSPSEQNSTKPHHHSHHSHHSSGSSSSSSSSHHHHSSSSKRDSSGSSKKDRENSSGSKKESSSSTTASSSRRHHDDKHRPAKLSMPKRNSVDLESPKSASKNNSFSESTGFMDAILHSMSGEDGKKRKRRLSEREDEPVKKKETPDKRSDKKADEEEEEEDAKPTFSFYRDTLEEPKEEPEDKKEDRSTKESKDDDEEMAEPSVDVKEEASPVSEAKAASEDSLPFEEPESMPREVKGILVYHRGKEKRNKRIRFKKDSDLVSVRLFEVDEEERVNVHKMKMEFENMRKFELNMEKAALKSKNTIDEETDADKWTKPIPIIVDNREPFVYGHSSKEKDIQFNREKSVLAAFLYSKETTPDTPAEPDAGSMMFSSAAKPKVIPLEDLSADGENCEHHDYSGAGWPEPHTNQVPILP